MISLEKNPNLTDADIARAMSSNLCRGTGGTAYCAGCGQRRLFCDRETDQKNYLSMQS
jgi:aerobic-type carbon monoxide dehydrogenase small subunit (CoxS/CutS family)